MQTLTIALDKEPNLAALLADKEPGDKITLHTSVKDLNDQTATLTITGCEEGPDDEDEEDDDEPAETKSEEPVAAPEKKSYAKQYMEKAGVNE